MTNDLQELLEELRHHAELTDCIPDTGVALDRASIKLIVGYIAGLKTQAEQLKTQLLEEGEFYDGSHGDI